MKKILKLLCVLMFIGGCQNKTEKAILHIYYSTTCATCKQLEASLLKKLETMDLNIEMHDIDDIETKGHYFSTIAKLKDPSDNLSQEMMVPLLALEGHFATVGYVSTLDDLYIELIQDALNNKDIGAKLPSGSWLYKK